LLFDAAGSELRLEGRPAARFTLLSGDEFYSTENSEEPYKPATTRYNPLHFVLPPRISDLFFGRNYSEHV